MSIKTYQETKLLKAEIEYLKSQAEKLNPKIESERQQLLAIVARLRVIAEHDREAIQTPPPKQNSCIVVDIDGTLVDVEFIPTSDYLSKDWDLENERNEDNPVFRWCSETILAFYKQGYDIVFLTGRSSTERIVASTRRMLEKHFPSMKYELLMREAGDDAPSCLDIKIQRYNESLKGRRILFFLEDRKEIQEWFKSQGEVCLLFEKPTPPH